MREAPQRMLDLGGETLGKKRGERKRPNIWELSEVLYEMGWTKLKESGGGPQRQGIVNVSTEGERSNEAHQLKGGTKKEKERHEKNGVKGGSLPL